MCKIEGIVEKVRDGLFLAASRTYGEQYIEPFIRYKYNLAEPDTDDYDAVDVAGLRYEIKACKVLKDTGNQKGMKNLLDRILFENENLETNRLVPFSKSETEKYLANVQNVKRDHFEILIYVLLFSDCVKIFFVESDQIQKGTFKNWSDKHGRYDQEGKSGQFGITKATIAWHLERYLRDTSSYEELAKAFEKISENYENDKYDNSESNEEV
jgi:hypothetical protein